MRNAFFLALAAFLAIGVHGGIPTSAEGWYTPSKGFTRQEGKGTVVWTDGQGTEHTTIVTVDNEGKIASNSTIDFQDNAALKTAYNALVKACDTEAYNAMQDEAINTIGKNLHDLTSATGINITNPETGKSYTIRFGGGTIENAVNTTGGGDIPATSDEDDPADGVSLTWTGVGNTLEIAGWNVGSSDVMTPLAEAMTGGSGSVFDNYAVLVRNKNKGVNYVKVGSLVAGGAPVDGKSVTTNTSEGAVSQGQVSLYGFADVDGEDFGIPYKYGDYLLWRGASVWVDNSSLAWNDKGEGLAKFEVKGASEYAGQHAKHYFGTGSDKTAVLGWHELPNVTTNMVLGDGVTVETNPNIPGVTPEEGVKYMGLKGWNYAYAGADPVFLVNMGGALGYIPFTSVTNMASCACTNKWRNLLGWFGDGEVNEDDGITFSDSNLDQYLYGTLGYIYSTTADNLHFDNDGEGIEASFTAPVNWADGSSVETTDDGQYQIKGFDAASACEASVSDMLSDPTGSDATTHLLLAKKTDSGELHYVSLGNGIAPGGSPVDCTTVTTNTSEGALTQGEVSIRGWSQAENDTYFSKNASGQVEWRKVASMPPVDGTSIVTNGGTMAINGFAAAAAGSVPWKNTGGQLAWKEEVAELQSITFVTDVTWDESNHQLKVTKITLPVMVQKNFATTPVQSVVLTATSHADEHSGEDDD